jgi:hypothetical protein
MPGTREKTERGFAVGTKFDKIATIVLATSGTKTRKQIMSEIVSQSEPKISMDGASVELYHVVKRLRAQGMEVNFLPGRVPKVAKTEEVAELPEA